MSWTPPSPAAICGIAWEEFLIFGAAHVRLRRIPIEARSSTNNQSVPFYDAARHLRLPVDTFLLTGRLSRTNCGKSEGWNIEA